MQVEDYMIIGYEMSGQFKRFLDTKLWDRHNAMNAFKRLLVHS